ncbi:MAG TPA: glycosyltransferase [Flavobacterium sp.]|nr:glycosyltransferase [Flavobacterium sp.]
MKRKKLVVISHTEHYLDQNGVLHGWGSTVNEINFLADSWEEVYHVGCLHSGNVPASSSSYIPKNIHFVPIPPYGGKRLWDKFLILFKIPKIIYQVVVSIKEASEVQLRLPTSMGLFLLPLFSFFIKRKFTFWVKYAGNWKQENPPLSYRMQRWWLKKNYAKCKVTINGFWDDQPAHCLSFENPCLTVEDIEKGLQLSKQKEFNPPFIFSFVGRLETAKGVDRIIEALKNVSSEEIAEVHFIGDGNRTDFYKEKASFFYEKVQFHGFIGKQKVHDILAKSHFFLLPSASEGFPKVIAEAACYGTIPVVSNVSSIPHYINSNNGFLWDTASFITFDEVLSKAIHTDPKLLKDKSNSIAELAKSFTFANYMHSLNTILNKNKN